MRRDVEDEVNCGKLGTGISRRLRVRHRGEVFKPSKIKTKAVAGTSTIPNTKNCSCSLKPNQAGIESMGARGSAIRGWAGQEKSRAGWTWEAAGSHTYTPSGLRLDTRGFCRLRGCPRNCLAVGRGGDSTGVTLRPERQRE